MKLKELLDKHPYVSLAQAEDNVSILQFFDKIPITGEGLQLQYKRDPDFFKFLTFHSHTFFVFLLKEQSSIEGVGTLVIRDGFIHGERCSIGYLGDLRVNKGFKNAIRWRNFYQDLLDFSSEIEEFRHCNFFSTAVIDSNKSAQTALVKKGKKNFSYNILHHYKMCNIYGAIPFKKKSRLRARHATADDLSAIQEYIDKTERIKNFGYSNLLSHALNSWPKFSIDNFILVFENEKICGLGAPWSPSPAKKIILKKLPLKLKILSLILKLFKPSFPGENEELLPLYLTHLNYNSSEALQKIIEFAFEKKLVQKYHLLSFAIFNSSDEEALSGFICDLIPMCLYQVYSDLHSNTSIINKKRPGLEIALV